MAAAMSAASYMHLRRIGDRRECNRGAGDRQRDHAHHEHGAERTIFHGNCLEETRGRRFPPVDARHQAMARARPR